MPELKLEQKVKNILNVFIGQLKDIYKSELMSVILYGSASSGEFIDQHSNLNLLIVLKDTGLENLKKITNLLGKFKFRMIRPLFFTEEFMAKSCDVFPIEFIDIKENYNVLYGKDTLADMRVDLRNLRFQCEHEIKAKLINIRQRYLLVNKDKTRLRDLLFKSFTSAIHISRNILRLKGREPVYLKQDVLKEIEQEFKINIYTWGKILLAKNKKVKIKSADIEPLLIDFLKDLEKIAGALDKT